jgi:DNA-binding transcriptional regulator YiaG
LSRLAIGGTSWTVLPLFCSVSLQIGITPEETERALTNRDKGWRLKKAILEDFEHFRQKGWHVDYQFPDGGFDAFLSGFIDIAPHLDTSKAIYNTFNSRQLVAEPVPPPPRRKSAIITGEKIKKARLAKGWTQRELVKVLDAYLEVSQRKISFWESGKTIPTVKEARTLKQILDI